MQTFAALGTSVSVAATASSVAGAITMPDIANALYVANTSATLYVTIAQAVSAAAATLGTGVTIPPMSQVLIESSPKIASVAAIGSAAGPTAVVFTPARVLA